MQFVGIPTSELDLGKGTVEHELDLFQHVVVQLG
jgi:hypothetical protein